MEKQFSLQANYKFFEKYVNKRYSTILSTTGKQPKNIPQNINTNPVTYKLKNYEGSQSKGGIETEELEKVKYVYSSQTFFEMFTS